MGRVYLGWDEALERQVAIKAMRKSRALSDELKARFLREARLLSRLDHAHICRVYDLVAGDDSDYLILEYIEGRTLQKVAPELSYDAKLRVAGEIADALGAAHREKIVHRDLKPDNVMITNSGDVKVLDFGIARPLAARETLAESGDSTSTVLPEAQPLPETIVEGPRPAPEPGSSEEGTVAGELSRRANTSRAASSEGVGSVAPSAAGSRWSSPGHELTTRGSVVGTARYMSPEQARGEEVTEASDLYSLGVLLQELFTGRSAYSASSPVELLEKAARAATEPCESLDADLAQLVGELSSLEPAARPSAQVARERLAWMRDKPRRRRRRMLTGATALAVVTALAATAVVTARWASPPPLVAPGETARLALLPFENATGRAADDWVEYGLPELVGRLLDASPRVELVPAAEVVAGLQRLEMADAAELDEEQLGRLLGAVGADLAVQTRVEHDDEGYRLVYAVLGRGLEARPRELTAETLTAAADEVAARLALRLDPESRVVVADHFSEDPYANAIYAMGVQRLDSGGPQAAQRYFEVCLDRDQEFHWARARLAKVRYELGEPERSVALFEEALSGALRRDDRKLEATALRGLAVRASDAADYAHSDELLRQSLAASGAIGDEHEAIDSLNNLASNAFYQGRPEQAEELWREVAERAEALGYWRRAAAALNNLGAVTFQRHDLDATEDLWRRAVAAATRMGDRLLAARVSQNLALVLKDRRQLESAEAMEREVLAAYRELGFGRGLPAAMFNLSESLSAQGRWEEAEPLAREAYERVAELEDPFLELRMLGAVLEHAARSGDFAEAETLATRGRELAADSGSPEARANFATVMADYLLRRGEVSQAGAWLDEAEAFDAEESALIMLRARWEYLQGHRERALELAREARAIEDLWTAWMEAEHRLYERAVAEGRQLPLP